MAKVELSLRKFFIFQIFYLSGLFNAKIPKPVFPIFIQFKIELA